jgi:hypothetical protein
MNTDSHRSGLQPDGSYILDDSILSTDQYSVPNPKLQNQEQMKPDYKFLDRLPSLSKVELLVLKGLISGDGDIGGRMASSHANAKPPVSKLRFCRRINKANVVVPPRSEDARLPDIPPSSGD